MLNHVPPLVASVNDIVAVEHSTEGPVIAGAAFMVITADTEQPDVPAGE